MDSVREDFTIIDEGVNQNRPLGDLITEFSAHNKQDILTPADTIELGVSKGGVFCTQIQTPQGVYQHRLNDWGHRQLDDKLKAGLHTFGQKCYDDEVERQIYVNTVNDLLRHNGNNQTLMIRTHANTQTARAVLSNAYCAIDDDVVFGTSAPIIADAAIDFQSIGGNRTSRRSYLKFVSREPQFEIHDGKRTRAFHVGFIQSNSEVGSGYAAFEAFVTDAFCTNGCIFSKLEVANARFAHRGSRFTTDVPMLMQDHVNRAKREDAARMIEAATVAAVTNEGQSAIKALLTQAAESKIEGSPIETVKQLAKNFSLTGKESERLLQLSGNEGENRFGMQAAITQLAQEAPTYDRRIQMEKVGGEVLTNDRLWKAVRDLD